MKRFFSHPFNIFIFAIIFLSSCSNGKYKSSRNLTIAFYNVENLFDLEDEPGKKDEEFLPGSKKKWNEERYTKKLEGLSRVLSSINKNELPEIIGLCEVENSKVVEDLINTGRLANGKYKVVHYESPDFRGIDCALVYRPDEFKVITSFPIKVNFKNEPNYFTRDILYVKGETKNGEEFHIFVNHWPSRIGGTEKTEPNRIEVATILKSKIDSIQTVDASAEIIVLGDMNDEPSNNSLAKILMAQKPEVKNAGFVNLMYPVHENKKGSYLYQENWNMLDNIVVSSNLLDDKGFQCADKRGFVFHKKWMEYKNKNGEISPNKTYGGTNYYGGISDHFPVYFTLQR
ncbi:MAG: endonuclease [Draconibacterium sp.]|nr:endonuclease [Draconibacterium sp.]